MGAVQQVSAGTFSYHSARRTCLFPDREPESIRHFGSPGLTGPAAADLARPDPDLRRPDPDSGSPERGSGYPDCGPAVPTLVIPRSRGARLSLSWLVLRRLLTTIFLADTDLLAALALLVSRLVLSLAVLWSALATILLALPWLVPAGEILLALGTL